MKKYWMDLRNPLLVLLLGCVQLLPEEGGWGIARIVLDVVIIAVLVVSLVLAITARKRGEDASTTQVTSGWMTWTLLGALVFYMASLILDIFQVVPVLALILLMVGLVASAAMLVLVICRLAAKKG